MTVGNFEFCPPRRIELNNTDQGQQTTDNEPLTTNN